MTPVTAEQFIRKWRPDSPLKHSGNWIIHRCVIERMEPHHVNGDRGASAEMNVRSGVYICFAYMDHAISFKHLCRIMHEKYNFEYEQEVPDDLQKVLKDKFADYDEPSLNISVYQRCTHPYMLKERHFSQEVLDLAQVKYDQYSGRIAIPVFKDGRCIAIQRRTIPGVVLDGRIHPKYEWTKGFDKSHFLYSVGELDASKPLLVVESVMSVFRAWDYGLHNCCALFGSHMSQYQADLLKRFDSIILWLDGDNAGQSGIKQAIKLLSGKQLLIVDATGYGTQDIADLPFDVTKQLLANAVTPLQWVMEVEHG